MLRNILFLISGIALIGASLFLYFNYESLTNTSSPDSGQTQLSDTDIKSLSKINDDIFSSNGFLVVSIKRFFENKEKELFVEYDSEGFIGVAKLVNNKWQPITEFNGSPECFRLDNAGVDMKMATIEFGCIEDGVLRAEQNPEDMAAYEEYRSSVK